MLVHGLILANFSAHQVAPMRFRSSYLKNAQYPLHQIQSAPG